MKKKKQETFNNAINTYLSDKQVKMVKKLTKKMEATTRSEVIRRSIEETYKAHFA